MNRATLKTYAPQARRDFIQAVTDRAAFYGLSANKIAPVVERGDVAVIAGREHPRPVAKKRNQLEGRIRRDGFGQTMEALAYTWFNRVVAIRFMELHGYLEHGYRVLSHPEGKATPEVLEQAEHVELPGLSKEAVIDLMLAGNKDAELYRLLLVAQCNALNTAMPFLFEKIDDETELLLPEHLLHSDSLIRKLVSEIDEEDWREVEIIGWLYQFYISEKKDEVIGKVVASEDIPAATQLFTPNWIVKYLVQNSLGRQWLATYPQSALRQRMEYYIEPAEQSPEVQAQLKTMTPTSLNPEELTLLDPACGSGHILVEAYDLFKAIYQERGYRAKDIPALILKRNLFGLEIDERAAQLAAFALMMKARADDRRVFDSDAKPNILAFQASQGLDAAEISNALNSPISKEVAPSAYLIEEIEEGKAGLFSRKLPSEKGQVSGADIASLLSLFVNAKTFGSLIQVPPQLASQLPQIAERLDEALKHGDLVTLSAHALVPLLQQAAVLARQYDVIATNPPYMGKGGFTPALRTFADEAFPDSRQDLFSMFVERCVRMQRGGGYVALVTMHSWMFLSSFEALRKKILDTTQINSLLHLGAHAFDSISGEVVQTAAFVLQPQLSSEGATVFVRAVEGDDSAAKSEAVRARRHVYARPVSAFKVIPGWPLAYWLPDKVLGVFRHGQPLASRFPVRAGMATGDNPLFVRLWHEVPHDRIGFGLTSRDAAKLSGKKWFPFNKGGEFRKWYGNNTFVVNFQDDGADIKRRKAADLAAGRITANNSKCWNQDFYFLESVSWTKVGTSTFCVRYSEPGGIASDASNGIFAGAECLRVAGLLCSPIAETLIAAMNPTLNVQVGNVSALPYLTEALASHGAAADRLCREAVAYSEVDWNNTETSWGFSDCPLIRSKTKAATVADSWKAWRDQCFGAIAQMRQLETANNKLFIDAYGLEGQLAPEVPEDQITLRRAERNEDIKRLLSYGVGCMMGRYSLDKPGLMYAHCGNQGFDANDYRMFHADDDGIIPLLESDWGIRDDATNRVVEFVSVVWPKEDLEENLRFIADSLGPASSEQPRDTIRRYFTTGFYRHHLSMYKKRPIYWLFSSGKQRALQCLVYLHRYHEGTLARMRTEYVIPLQGQVAARIEQLDGDKAKATSTSHRRKIQKEQDDLKKQQAELAAFEEKLKHAADQKITLDLDDGVRVNYGKFGDLLAESKAIAGDKDDE